MQRYFQYIYLYFTGLARKFKAILWFLYNTTDHSIWFGNLQFTVCLFDNNDLPIHSQYCCIFYYVRIACFRTILIIILIAKTFNKFVLYLYSTAESYRKSFIATSGGEALKAHKLFCSWDFGISNKRSANMKCDSIYFELRTILNELYDSEYQMSIWQKVGCYVISVAIWIFTIVVLIGTGYSIVYGNILDVSID